MHRLSRLLLIAGLIAITIFAAFPAQAQTYPAWQPNTAYSVGQQVTYQDSTHANHLYKCQQAHTSLTGWEPPNVPALWIDEGAYGGSSATATNTAAPTNTAIPATATKTNTPTGATATNTSAPTKTNTPKPATSTTVPPTNTSVPPTATSSGSGSYPAWAANVAYSIGTQVTYQDSSHPNHLYKCQQAHTSQTGWEPPNAPALWVDEGAYSGGTSPTNTATFVPATNTPGGKTNTPAPTATSGGSNGNGKHVIIGYWHNFDNGSGFIPLTQVSNNYDVIDVAFAAPNSGAPNGEMDFAPYNETTAQFQADIQTMHGRGKKVLISSGGYNGSTFKLSDDASTNNFINSMENIISTYGFDGMDIDWEQQVLSLNSGDKDITNPTTPDVVNTIKAITTIHNHFGSSFMLSYGMETFFVQLGYSFYGGTCLSCDTRAGSLLPVIYATRSFTNYVQVQLYNSGSITALDNNSYADGSPDFLVAMTDMLLRGFTVAGTGQTFPALSPSQLAIGVPASSGAASNYLAPADLEKAFDYLDRGISFGGSYQMTKSGGYPGVAGFMTWSINWDQYANFGFSNPIRSYLDGLSQ